MKTVIMAGGKGTRISSIANDIPKPMIKIDGKPVLEHELECLREQGFTDIIITISHLGHVIMDYFGDGSKISPVTGKPFGVSIEYFFEEKPLGNAGALFALKEKLKGDFLLLNADAIFDVDFKRFVNYHKQHGGLVTLFTHPNNHPFDSGLIISDNNNSVLQWLTKEDKRDGYYRNRVNAGLHVVNSKLLELEIKTERIDLDRQLLKPLAGTGKMFVYDSPEYVKDMGTPERYEMVCQDYQNGKVKARNLKNKQKAIFLDRDGTINKYVGFLKNINDFELLPNVDEAIRKINYSNYLVIVVTNQPVVARGEVSFAELEMIHNKMETLLGKNGSFLDAIYYCPHHPHKGYDGEIEELKFDCDCRKPKPGMLYQAAKDYNIDLNDSWMIGDSENDILCGKNAGCKTILISNNNKYDADLCYNNLYSAINCILKGEKTMENRIDELIKRYPVLKSCEGKIVQAFEILKECFKNNHKLLLAGNGGSCSDCEHIAGELMKGFKKTRSLSKEEKEKILDINKVKGEEIVNSLQSGLPCIVLSDHMSLNTAFINDVKNGGEYMFAQQLNVFGIENDVFLAISTSGSSKNIINAAIVAKAKGIKIIGLTGMTGGELLELSDVTINVPELETYKIQEYHLPIYHCLCLMIEDYFFGA